MFCVRCGREGATYQSLCHECFLSSNRFTSIPDHIDLIQCAHCQAYQLGKDWARFEDIEDAVKEAAVRGISVSNDAKLRGFQVDIEEMEPTTFQVHILASVQYEDLMAEEDLNTIVRIRQNVCGKCNKIFGNYFESIVQVRPTGKKLSEKEKDEILDHVADKVEPISHENQEAFISKVVTEHGGLDLYVSTIALGKALARELVNIYGAEYKESSSLQGQKDGKDIYRVTYLVRLPPYRVRDIISFNSHLYLVLSMGPVSAKLRELRSSENTVASNNDLRTVAVLGSKKDFQDAVVLTETDKEMQIMHPVTFKTVEMKKPKGFKRKGDTVKVFSHEGELYLIGN